MASIPITPEEAMDAIEAAAIACVNGEMSEREAQARTFIASQLRRWEDLTDLEREEALRLADFAIKYGPE